MSMIDHNKENMVLKYSQTRDFLGAISQKINMEICSSVRTPKKMGDLKCTSPYLDHMDISLSDFRLRLAT